ncbi:MAG: guanylate kinase [Planctomycetes bacterium]|nr:guanylate kinase [Planctomycetota bacterium]
MRPLSKGLVAVIAGPSGVGKTTICQRLRADPLYRWSVSCTTRAPRPYEREGEHYHFVTRPRFEQMIAGGELLEWARVFDNLYGTPKAPLEAALKGGAVMLLDIDIGGAEQVRRLGYDAAFIFLKPPSEETLISRLRGRGEAETLIPGRVARYREELARAAFFHAFVVNDDLDAAVAATRSAIEARHAQVNGGEPPARAPA